MSSICRKNVCCFLNFHLTLILNLSNITDVSHYPSFQWGLRCFFMSSTTPSNHCQKVKLRPGKLSCTNETNSFSFLLAKKKPNDCNKSDSSNNVLANTVVTWLLGRHNYLIINRFILLYDLILIDNNTVFVLAKGSTASNQVLPFLFPSYMNKWQVCVTPHDRKRLHPNSFTFILIIIKRHSYH